ncbi:MAG: hypothetical protein ACD_4C00115G0009 [uncultured bacterium (gcode 4)]|uniref:Signal peptidase I n=1 Tax=uncultured bacterium (gcode 4) TaxID=1234023 RepID=K2FVD8_9BACT|nr:MAG: hypothetical protein ACD_4C00115G0009 [uncultured bacterium (gcode 4)]
MEENNITSDKETIEKTPEMENPSNEVNTEITELKPEKPKMEEFIEFVRDLIIIFIIVMIIRTFIAAPFQISWSSMEASYHDKEFIIVDKFSYAKIWSLAIWNPWRWDVVIFRPHASNWKEFYIKRVIWLPWEKIKFQDWEVYIEKNNEFIKLNEDYLSTNKWKTFLPADVKENTFTIPDNEYFLMWDNRNNSSDSRSCFLSCSIEPSSHFIKRSDILWKVFLDFGYFNIFKEWTLQIWDLKWIDPPRFLNTPKTWDYKELN